MRESSDRPACYPLVPYSNRIRAASLAFEGRRHALARNFGGDHPHSIHGVGWQSEWHVVQASARRATLELVHDARNDAARAWPWPFRAIQSIDLADDDERAVLTMGLTIENIGAAHFPFGLGWHPFFPRDASTILAFDADQVWRNDDTQLPLERAAIIRRRIVRAAAGVRVRDDRHRLLRIRRHRDAYFIATRYRNDGRGRFRLPISDRLRAFAEGFRRAGARHARNRRVQSRGRRGNEHRHARAAAARGVFLYDAHRRYVHRAMTRRCLAGGGNRASRASNASSLMHLDPDRVSAHRRARQSRRDVHRRVVRDVDRRHPRSRRLRARRLPAAHRSAHAPRLRHRRRAARRRARSTQPMPGAWTLHRRRRDARDRRRAACVSV